MSRNIIFIINWTAWKQTAKELMRIWGSHFGGYEKFCLLGYGLHGVMSQKLELFKENVSS
jgi:hypothetical protein